MKRFVLGVVLGSILIGGALAVSQNLDERVLLGANQTQTFDVRDPYSVMNHLPDPKFQVLYDKNGRLFGEAYQNSYGLSILYDSAGRFQGMIQNIPNR